MGRRDGRRRRIPWSLCETSSKSSVVPHTEWTNGVQCIAALCGLGASAAKSQTPDPKSSRGVGVQNPPKEVVTGIGGFFFKAKDPKALAEWYATNLGVARTRTAKGMEPWRQDSGIRISFGNPNRRGDHWNAFYGEATATRQRTDHDGVRVL
jgi:hypothetical protein